VNMKVSLLNSLSLLALAMAHGVHDQSPLGPHKRLWYNSLPGDGGTQVCFVPSYNRGSRLGGREAQRKRGFRLY
jgi:hypothetical protein